MTRPAKILQAKQSPQLNQGFTGSFRTILRRERLSRFRWKGKRSTLVPIFHKRLQKTLNLFLLFLFSQLRKKVHTKKILRIFRSQFYIAFSHACRVSHKYLLQALKKLGKLFEDRGESILFQQNKRETYMLIIKESVYNPKEAFVKFYYETFL